jgi:exodeoxyribonuclease-5
VLEPKKAVLAARSGPAVPSPPSPHVPAVALEPKRAIEALGLELSEDQEVVFHRLYDWMQKRTSGTLTFGGYAGTGKTTLLSGLAKAFDQERRLAFCALSGRAATVLQRKLAAIGIETGPTSRHYCGTIHGLLYRARMDRNGRFVEWIRNASVGEYATIIVDEASMVPERIYQDLASEGIPILAVGDHGQLPPVEGNPDFGLMKRPHLTLSKIHRQAEGSPIIRLSRMIRETGGFDDSVADKQSIYVARKSLHLSTAINNVALMEPEELLDRAFLCYRNKTRAEINQAFRQARFEGSPPSLPQAGELVVCLKNSREEGVFNGYRGIATSNFTLRGQHHVQGSVSFPEENVELTNATFSRWQWGRQTFKSFDQMHEFGFRPTKWDQVGLLFDYGYGLTVHKAQGSQFSRVFIVVERPGPVDDDTFGRWLYTAVTRATEKVFLFRE